jgi:hypothetical protein
VTRGLHFQSLRHLSPGDCQQTGQSDDRFSGAPVFSTKYNAMKTILFERTSKPRYAEAVLISPFFLFSHSKKPFLTFSTTTPLRVAVCHPAFGQEERARSCRHRRGPNGEEGRASRGEMAIGERQAPNGWEGEKTDASAADNTSSSVLPVRRFD